MSDWSNISMRELCDITSSKRIHRSDYVEAGVPFYRGKEITEKYNGKLDVSTELFISEEQFTKIKTKFGAPLEGDLLLTSVGTLGSPYVVKRGDRFYFKDGNLTWFRNLRGIDSHFLYYWIASPSGRAELKKATIGSSQSAYTIALLKQMQVSLPPLPTQKKIASILSAYDDLIGNNERRIKILEEMAQNLYREWFVNFRFPLLRSDGSYAGHAGHEKVKMVDSPLGKIPEGWEVLKVDDAFTVLGGGTPSKKEPAYWDGGDVNWYTPTDLTKSNALYAFSSGLQITELGLQKSSAKMFPAGSVMMTSRATIGAMAISETDACTNQGFIISIPNERCPASFIYYWIKENMENILNHASGATFKEIGRRTFKNFDILLPEGTVIVSWNDLVTPMWNDIRCLLRKNIALRQTRDLLLPKLISGGLDLSELDINGGGVCQE